MKTATPRRRSTRVAQSTAVRAATLALVIMCALLPAGCGARRVPDLQRIFAGAREREGKRPLIVIPGVLGSQLVNRRTGEVVWPSAFRSSDDGLSLPVSPDLAANTDDLYADKILDRARLARLAPEFYVYYELLEALKNYGGYREGNWNDPGADGDRDTFYIFAYDWRRDNVENARELVRRLDELKRRMGREDLRFNIVAHSMGGLIARYAAMYGERDLAPEGQAPEPDWAGARSINRILMFGVPNEGSAEAFATLLEGYSVTEGLRRRVRLLNKLSREDALTIPSIYQLLPHAASARFLDANLAPLAIDLYDPATWRRYGWAALHDAAYRERFARGDAIGEAAPGRNNSLDNLDAYFAAVLRRARRFHEAIDAPDKQASPSPVAMFVFGGDCEETLAAPVVMFDKQRDAWLTLTAPREFRDATGKRMTKKAATAAMYQPGDGRVTRRSLLGEELAGRRRHPIALYDSSLPILHAVFACDLHSDLQNNKNLQDNALTLLVSEAMK